MGHYIICWSEDSHVINSNKSNFRFIVCDRRALYDAHVISHAIAGACAALGKRQDPEYLRATSASPMDKHVNRSDILACMQPGKSHKQLRPGESREIANKGIE